MFVNRFNIHPPPLTAFDQLGRAIYVRFHRGAVQFCSLSLSIHRRPVAGRSFQNVMFCLVIAFSTETILSSSNSNILFSLSKLGKSLGHHKLVRIAYKKMQTLRIPEKLAELIEIGSIEMRTKPFKDSEVCRWRCDSMDWKQ